MGFGGSVSAMIASLKANKRSRISTFEKLKNHTKREKSELHFDKKATSYELKKIKEKVNKENEIAFWKKVIILLVSIIAILIFLNYIET